LPESGQVQNGRNTGLPVIEQVLPSIMRNFWMQHGNYLFLTANEFDRKKVCNMIWISEITLLHLVYCFDEANNKNQHNDQEYNRILFG
jgi:hypothetical protein